MNIVETPVPFPRIAIIGPGLLGGSIALALRERSPQTVVTMWARRSDAVAAAEKIAHFASTEIGDVVADADLVILCVPIGAMRALAKALAPFLKPSALVTDVGSVKAPVVSELAPVLGSQFIGSHPMAGSEQAGLEAARADLFQNAACLVTPDSSDPVATDTVSAFWTALGCRVFSLSPAGHDQAVAWVSHLPHLTAAALVDLVATKNADALRLCGNGFRDTTRVAAGPAEMWTGIALANREPLQTAVEAMIEKLGEIAKLLAANDPDAMNRFLSAAQCAREQL
jgi:prephenate dehydrogenase